MEFGYARCSTRHQDATYEINALMKLGVPRENIFIDYVSGGKTRNERPEYDKLMKMLETHPKSTLRATEFTRIARNNLDIYYLCQDMERLKICLVVAGFTIDCRNDILDPISELLIGVMGQFATFDLKNKRFQCRLGIDDALERGVKFGRPIKTKESLENDPKFLKYYIKWKQNEISLCEFQRLLGVKSRTTCYNWIKLFEKRN